MSDWDLRFDRLCYLNLFYLRLRSDFKSASNQLKVIIFKVDSFFHEVDFDFLHFESFQKMLGS